MSFAWRPDRAGATGPSKWLVAGLAVAGVVARGRCMRVARGRLLLLATAHAPDRPEQHEQQRSANRGYHAPERAEQAQAGQADGAAAGAESGNDADDVVDAEFEEVKDNK